MERGLSKEVGDCVWVAAALVDWMASRNMKWNKGIGKVVS